MPQKSKVTQTKHLIIDTKTFDQIDLNDYVYRLVDPVENVVRLRLNNVSLPEIRYNVGPDEHVAYKKEGEEIRRLTISPGYYTIERLIAVLVEAGIDAEYDAEKDRVALRDAEPEPGRLWRCLGWREGGFSAAPDLRPTAYSLLVLSNITDQFIGRAGNLSRTLVTEDVVFKSPRALTELHVVFKDDEGRLIDFDGRPHVIDISLDVLQEQ